MVDAWIIELSSFTYDSSNTYMIWYEDDHDHSRIYTINNKPACFHNERSARDMMINNGFCYKDTEKYDTEKLLNWCSASSGPQKDHGISEIGCGTLIDFWNLFDDIYYSLDPEYLPVMTRRSRRCYYKLFHGIDLPMIKLEGYRYDPVFTRKDIRFIRTFLKQGIDHLSDNIVYYD